uniref:Lysophospholipid acyltransferase 5 n=1 Tax=Caligus clemensi TaxID=344056 RepID=C1C2A5_CALCM|nr:Transmembrane protein nessy [Caligus clemensi]
MSWINLISEYYGVPTMALRLLLGILLTYPINLVFMWSSISKSSALRQHAFFILSGMILGWWSLGLESMFHGSLSILGTYALLKILGPSYLTTVICFIFCFGYLVVGYILTETDTYDICWTMPHCVLTLRLIAIAFDVWDGTKPKEELGKDQLKNRLERTPSLIEMFSAVFFPASYLIGPQFSFARYHAFIERNSTKQAPQPPIGRTLICLMQGFGYLFFHAIGSIYFPLDWVTSSNYINLHYGPSKVFYTFLWVKVMMSKYIGSWLLTEGSMVLSGLAYDPDASGGDPWDGGRNVRIQKWEFSGNLQDMVDSFNINTNTWAASYVYKRLRFLNNRTISSAATLFFLSIWHGLHSGYYVTFFLEFLMLNFERSVRDVQERFSTIIGKPLRLISGVIYIMLVLPHCFMPFGLPVWEKYWPIIYHSYGMPYGFFLLWPLMASNVKSLILKFVPKKEV